MKGSMNRLLFFGDRLVAYLTIYREGGKINETCKFAGSRVLIREFEKQWERYAKTKIKREKRENRIPS